MPHSKLTLLGRTIGTFSGWDGDPGECITFYNFEPSDAIRSAIPAGELQFDVNSGTATVYAPLIGDELHPKEIFTADVVTFLAVVPRDDA